jgi:hypothetical protein
MSLLSLFFNSAKDLLILFILTLSFVDISYDFSRAGRSLTHLICEGMFNIFLLNLHTRYFPECYIIFITHTCLQSTLAVKYT